MRSTLLIALVPLALTACKKGDEAAAPAPAATAPAVAAATACAGFQGDKPVPFCLATAPAGCKLETVKDNQAKIVCTNGAFTLSVYDPTDETLKAEVKAVMDRTTDVATQIKEQGVPAGGEGKFVAYDHADQRGVTHSVAVFKGAKRVWVCSAQVPETQSAEKDAFVKACRTLKEL